MVTESIRIITKTVYERHNASFAEDKEAFLLFLRAADDGLILSVFRLLFELLRQDPISLTDKDLNSFRNDGQVVAGEVVITLEQLAEFLLVFMHAIYLCDSGAISMIREKLHLLAHGSSFSYEDVCRIFQAVNESFEDRKALS